MDRAPVSVVIPAHNIESYVGDAIRSVLAQTLPVAEIIVVADDCSDQTPQVAEDLGATVLRLERGNISAARNLGIRASTQPWIAFLDADDFWEEDKIGFQWRAIKAWPSAAMISCDFFTVSNDKVTSPSERYLRERWNKLKTTAISGYCRYLEKIEGEFLSRVFLAVPTVMLRRDVFSGVGFFDENLIYGQALEFFARVLAQYPLAFVERPLVYQRVHASNHTRNVKGSWISYISVVDQ
ncbi:MAG TPA: glycosyltransferase family 2 protein, partial [Pyrinomonadaceae bacterium]|nr:glycosyltransferase family 2 protein [Pyrinomonadaceae bacterium]